MSINSISQDTSDELRASGLKTPLIDVKIINEDREDDRERPSDNDLTKLYEQEENLWPRTKFLWVFPVWLEKRLQKFDDPIIEFCQKVHTRTWYYISLFLTGLVAIELGIAAPFVLFIVGADGLATEFVYLALLLALLSQVPKRFCWRFRPYMVHRAKMMKKDMTSSFPSRAVTCATVYTYAIVWSYMYGHTGDDGSIRIEWWMPVLVLSAVFLSSFARINLGVHYPSDCIAGFLQGVIVCVIGTGLWSADVLGCETCRNDKCYSTSPETTLTLRTLGRLSPSMIATVAVISTVVPFVSVIRPIDFWVKCDRVYGMLLPAVSFQLLFLCPKASPSSSSLPSPYTSATTHDVTHGHAYETDRAAGGGGHGYGDGVWYDWLFAIVLAAVATAVGMKSNGKRPILMYLLIYISLFASLVFWRLGSV